MTLDEIFAKYSDDIEIKRLGSFPGSPPWNVADAKGLKDWVFWVNKNPGKPEVIIPQFIIDDVNANDWEIVNDI